VAEAYLVSAVRAIVVVAFVVTTIVAWNSSDILIVAEDVAQWIGLRVRYDSPLALLSVHH
jgi:hypothetical protein